MIEKNRNRDVYSFANINLLGRCNANCFFCLGKDISQELSGENQLKEHFTEWNRFNHFTQMCKDNKISKIYITGQTADGLQYHYLLELIKYLKDLEFSVGIRTNGYLALEKLDEINLLDDEVGYSIHTLNSGINKVIMGRDDIPDWNEIIPLSGDNVRIAIVINRYNYCEIDELLRFCSKFKNVKYIQLRRISTDTRLGELKDDIEIFEKYYDEFKRNNLQYGDYNLAQQFKLYGKEICFWRTVETSVNSLNYFTDGTCSEEYFVVEGYLKYRGCGETLTPCWQG